MLEDYPMSLQISNKLRCTAHAQSQHAPWVRDWKLGERALWLHIYAWYCVDIYIYTCIYMHIYIYIYVYMYIYSESEAQTLVKTELEIVVKNNLYLFNHDKLSGKRRYEHLVSPTERRGDWCMRMSRGGGEPKNPQNHEDTSTLWSTIAMVGPNQKSLVMMYL